MSIEFSEEPIEEEKKNKTENILQVERIEKDDYENSENIDHEKNRSGIEEKRNKEGLIINNIHFGYILNASGARGFFGEGYWYHQYLKPLNLNFDGSTFIAKTTTLLPHKGNLPLNKDYKPQQIIPRCIKVNPFKGVVLNSVGLSGPGAEALFQKGEWQKREKPFFISFMSVSENMEQRLEEMKKFTNIFHKYLPDFKGKVGLEINFSCPNVGISERNDFYGEVKDSLKTAAGLNIPLMPKFNVMLPVSLAKQISDLPQCGAISISNTIPWGKMEDKINWNKIFKSPQSPLKDLGGGGLSGVPLLSLVAEWVKKAREAGIKKPINAGGGILTPDDVNRMKDAGASSVFIGSVALLRPWRVGEIIQRAHEIYK